MEQPYLRKLKYEKFEYFREKIIDRTDKLSIKIIENASLTPLGQKPGISLSHEENIIVDDCDFYCKVENTQSISSSETVMYGGYYRHQWGHFLLNTTGRLWWLFEDNNLNKINKIIFFSLDGEDSLDGNYKEFFKLLGILDKIIITRKISSFKKIYIPEISFEHDVYYSRQTLLWVEKIKSSLKKDIKESESYDKIFLTRTALPCSNKKEVNLNYFDNLFERNGYKVISPEKLSLSSLIRIICCSKEIVTVSGSGAHNLIFASLDTKTVILERVATNNLYQINMEMMTRLNSIYVDSFLTPFIPVSTGRVFFYYPSSLLMKFIKENLYHSFLDSEIKKMKGLGPVKRFLKEYRHQSGLFIGLDDNQLSPINEAYKETLEIYGTFLTEWRLKYYLKKFLKRH